MKPGVETVKLSVIRGRIRTMSTQEIPYEAVAEASRAIDDDAYVLLGWEGITRLLEAAAPFIRARALTDAVDAFPLETITAPDSAVVWLRRRAEQIEGTL